MTKSCRRRICTVNLRVLDARPSAGIRQVTAKLSWKTKGTCRRGGRRVRCTRTHTRNLSVKSIGAGRFLVTTAPLSRGSYTLSVLATDKAGNHARRATTVALTVR